MQSLTSSTEGARAFKAHHTAPDIETPATNEVVIIDPEQVNQGNESFDASNEDDLDMNSASCWQASEQLDAFLGTLHKPLSAFGRKTIYRKFPWPDVDAIYTPILDTYLSSLVPGVNSADNDEIYASLLLDDITSDEEIVIGDDGIILAGDKDEINEPNITQKEILNNLLLLINDTEIYKFNIGRNYIWEGTKRALHRKSFKPQNKLSVKFTDYIGTSEGSVDLGGLIREFFTLVTEWMVNSELFFFGGGTLY